MIRLIFRWKTYSQSQYKKIYQEKNLPEEKLELFFPFYFVMSQMSWRPISQNDQTYVKNIPANAAWFLTCARLTNL